MSLGDLIFGVIIGYILLGLVWLETERIAQPRRQERPRCGTSAVDLNSVRRTANGR